MDPFHPHHECNSRTDPPCPPARALEILRRGTVDIEGLLPHSSNYTFLVRVVHAGEQTYAVYKPMRGERPLWDFPHGTLYKREYAAYLVSEAGGFGLVPPTVVCDDTHAPLGIGSLQLFIPHNPRVHLRLLARQRSHERTIHRLVAFDYLVNNADRKSGHCLQDANRRIWAIDHGICFHEEEKLRTVLWDLCGQPLAADVIHLLTALQQHIQQPQTEAESLLHALHHLLSHAEIAALHRRLDHLLTTRTYPAPDHDYPTVPWPYY